MQTLNSLSKQINSQLKMEWEWYNPMCQQKLYFVTEDGTKITTPCIHEYAKRDFNRIAHQKALELLELSKTYYCYDKYSDYDTENIGLPYQMYFSSWRETIAAVLKEIKDDNI